MPTAPYNFIPFVEPVTAEQFNGEGFRPPPLDVPVRGLRTGIIDYTVTALTPLYIGGGKGPDSLTLRDGQDNTFFWIPGSEIRGMLRNLLENILGGGLDDPALRAHHREPVSYRAAFSNHAEYRSAYWSARKERPEPTEDELAGWEEHSGLLRRHRSPEGAVRYSLAPVEYFNGTHSGVTAVRDAGDTRRNQFRKYWVDDDDHVAPAMNAAMRPADCAPGYVLYSGRPYRPHGGTAYVFVEDPAATKLDVPEEVIATYGTTRTKHAKQHIPELAHYWSANGGAPIPVFYDLKDGAVARIGLTPGFHITAARTVDDLIKPKHRRTQQSLTAVEAMFGRIEDDNTGDAADGGSSLASRIRVGHAMAPFDAGHLLPPQSPRMESPKLAATHMRLTGGDAAELTTFESSDAEYRGREVYLHRWPHGMADETAWEQAVQSHGATNTAVAFRPVRSGVKFTGRIRFTNLTDQELAALLFAIRIDFVPRDRQENEPSHAHKLGGLKPLGLGSVEISGELTLLEHASRYSGIPEGEASTDIDWRTLFLRSVRPHDDAFEALRLVDPVCRWRDRLPERLTAQTGFGAHANRDPLLDLYSLFNLPKRRDREAPS